MAAAATHLGAIVETEKRDEGFLIRSDDGRGVCSIECVTIGEKFGPNMKVPEKTFTPVPFDQWRIHFCAVKLSPIQLNEVLEIITKLKG